MNMPSLDHFTEEGQADPDSVKKVESRTALSPSKLPGLDLTLNPYRGCGHDCVYCYAPYLFRMPREEWHKVAAKANLPNLLAKEAGRKRGVIGLSTATDPYQPLESSLKLTRRCLQELVRAKAEVSVLTKSDLVLRDIDLLKALPKAEVGLTITTIEDRWAACFEPGAPSPSRRLAALKKLNGEGLDTYVFIGPILPKVTEERLDELIGAIGSAGCKRVMADRLRLRPGMVARFRSLPCAKDLGEEFFRHCEDGAHLARIEGRVLDLCARRGIAAQTAF